MTSNAVGTDTTSPTTDFVHVAELLGHHDWSATALGARSEWPSELRTAVDLMVSSRFAMWMFWGSDYTMLYNDAYARMTLGAKHPWAFGRSARQVWHEIWPELQPRIRAVLDEGVATWDERLLLFLERSGFAEESYHTFSYSPLRGATGNVDGMLCVVTEETERVIGERRLGTLRELASALSETTTEQDVMRAVSTTLARNAEDLPFAGMYLYELEGAAAVATLVASSGVTQSHEVLPARIVVDTMLAEAEPAWPASVVGVHAARRIIPIEAWCPVPLGAWTIATRHVLVAPIMRQGQEGSAGFLVVGTNPHRPIDETFTDFVGLVAGQIAASLDNARAYEQEAKRAATLAELDRAKSAFFSNVSHELRTPLTLILAPVDASVNDGGVLDGDDLRLVHRNALRLRKLVNAILDFSRIEAGRTRASFETTDVGSLTQQVAANFRSTIERGGLALRVEIDDTEELISPVDRDMWEKVVLNLLSNAFKHTFDGTISVVVRYERVSDSIVLEVSDTGVGIAPEQQQRVFERFHRVPNAQSRTFEGTGIGLSLVQEMVRLHNGSIELDSTVGIGSTFRVRMPRSGREVSVAVEGADSDVSDASGFVDEAERWSASNDSELPRDAADVLVVDDNADMRDYVATLLRQRGWSVDVAVDGLEALDKVRGRAPRLVVSDVMMPRLDGYGLLHELQKDQQTSEVPVLLLSARAGEEARAESLEAGAADHLVKPFNARELIARVGMHLERARVTRQERIDGAHRDRMLREAERERARLELLFREAPTAIAVLRGPNHVFELANDEYRKIVGGRNVMGKPIVEALPEIVDQGFARLLDEVFSSGVPYVGRSARVLLDNRSNGATEEHFFNFVYQPLFDSNGKVSGIFVNVVDVTTEVSARHDAEAANRAKSDFLASMSHELRTPLHAIGGYTQLLEMGLHGPVSDAQRDVLGRIDRSQQHLLALINDVLSFARIEAGKIEYDLQAFDVVSAIKSTKPMIEPQLLAKNIGCEVLTGGDAGPLLVRADQERVEQILVNLLSNAAKFTDRGGAITVAATADGDSVNIEVADTGVGIPDDMLESIFEPFVQVLGDQRSGRAGTGLGLSISRDLANGMGGSLTARNRTPRGSVFTLRLPRA